MKAAFLVVFDVPAGYSADEEAREIMRRKLESVLTRTLTNAPGGSVLTPSTTTPALLNLAKESRKSQDS